MKVLLFANVGSSPDGYYHVGDEAMYLETVRWYQENYPHTQLNAFSSQPNHPDLGVNEFVNFSYPLFKFKKYFIKLISLAFLSKYFNFNLLSTAELEFISAIFQQNLVHFTGGGNLTSLFQHWLYYSFALICIARINRIPVILSSQTIGPFNGIDKIIAFFVFNSVQLINIREPKHSLFKLGIFAPKINSTLDAAYSLKPSTTSIQSKSTNFRIGLSLHSWKHYDVKLIKSISQVINNLSRHYSIEIVFIPHIIIDSDHDNGGDLLFMNKIIKYLDNKVSVNTQIPKLFFNTKMELASLCKKITSSCDILLSTRYHGIIFSLSSNVPCISFILGPYYTQKNKNAFNFYYPNTSNYLVDLNKLNISQSLLSKSLKILKNLKYEKLFLKLHNKKLSYQDIKFNKDLQEYLS